MKSGLPRPEEFSRAIYTIDIGQNDLAFGLQHGSEEQVRGSIPEILSQFSKAVQVKEPQKALFALSESNLFPMTKLKLVMFMFQQLYNEGARVFWIHNTGPIGCLPYSYIYYEPKKGNLDAYGCVKPQNELAQEFNRQLKDRVFQLRKKLPLAKFTYVDAYTAKYQLISTAKSQGGLQVTKRTHN